MLDQWLSAMPTERWSVQAWPQVKADFKKALALKIRFGEREGSTHRHRRTGRHRREERAGGEHMNAETETAIQNLSKAFADTADTMKRIANSLANIELHLQAMRPSGVQTVRGPTR